MLDSGGVPEAHLQVFESLTFALNGKYLECLSEQNTLTPYKTGRNEPQRKLSHKLLSCRKLPP